jgi:MFS family permease
MDSAPAAEPPPGNDGAKAQPDWRRGFAVQLLVAALATTAIQAIRPTMTYRALALGAAPVQIGLIQSAYSIVPAFTAVLIGRWIDRAGESRYVMLGLGALTMGGLIATFAPGLLFLGLAQITLGLGQIVYLVASQSLIANAGPRDGREARFGYYSTAVSVGQLAGPAIAAAIVGTALSAALIGLVASANAATAPVVTTQAWGLPEVPEAGVFFFAALMSLVAGGLAILIPPSVRRRRADDASGIADAQPGILKLAGQVLRRSGMLSAMLVSIAVISAIDVLVAYLPAYGEDVGLSVALVGTLLSVRAGSSLVSRFFMTRLIARLGRSRLLALSMVMAGGGILVMPFVSSPVIFIAIMVVVGLGLGLGQPMTIAWVANRSPRRERATALGVRVTGNRTALLIVPTLMGVIAGTAGIAAIFIVVAISLGGGAVVAMSTSFDEPRDPTNADPIEPAASVPAEAVV